MKKYNDNPKIITDANQIKFVLDRNNYNAKIGDVVDVAFHLDGGIPPFYTELTVIS